MPVRKFRRVEDMPPPAWRRPGDPALARAIATVWTLGRALTPLKLKPGVHRKKREP